MPRSSLTLCWVGLVFSSLVGPTNGSSVTWMNRRLVAPELAVHLADRFEERQALDVADRAADLDDHHLGAGLARRPG